MLDLYADNPDEKLVVYGSLAPEGANNFLLAGLEGNWHRCLIRGRLGRYRGFKAFRYDPLGEEHPAWLLISPTLPERLPDLDDFEGEEYRRILIPARVGKQAVIANIYESQYVD
jgi:gamma-glutamylcyclotransferase (GGCT)/AIG2-like uncharacterized protein YtfP